MNSQLTINLTLEDLQTLIEASVRKALTEATPTKPDVSKNELLTIKQAAEYLSVSVPTIYGYVHKRSIPCMKRRGRLYFSKSELLAWVQSGKRSTLDEIKANALQSLER